MNKHQPHLTKQNGFTLLEMVLVLFLIGLVASASLMLTENVEDQARYDETKRRMELIRRAIVGDVTRTVNGAPEISGFAADMGRLPGCLAELLSLGDEKDPATDPKTFDSPCQNGETLTITEWNSDGNTGLSWGWRGPYVQTLPDREGPRILRDGWNNPATTDDTNFSNFGWNFGPVEDANPENILCADLDPDVTAQLSSSTVELQSCGLDGSVDDIAEDDSEKDDYPWPGEDKTLVAERDYQVDLDSWTGRVLMINTTAGSLPAADTNLKIRIHYPDGAGGIATQDSDTFTLTGGTLPASGSQYTPQITFSNGTLTMGVRAIEVLCDVDDSVFNGSCPSGVASPAAFTPLTLLPYAQPIEHILVWDIP